MVKINYGVKPLKVDILNWNEDGQMITYKVSGLPICQFDQHSRARVGIKFKDYSVSEYPDYVVYTQIHKLMGKDKRLRHRIYDAFSNLEKLRKQETWEKVKFNLMSRECSYIVEQSISSMRGQMMRRLKFCEEEFIVGLHWLLRDKMIKMGIDAAKSFVPGCDLIKRCDYSSADYLSNCFGCLFAGCGRWKDESDYASFNQSCTTPELLEKQLGIEIPRSEYEIDLKKELA